MQLGSVNSTAVSIKGTHLARLGGPIVNVLKDSILPTLCARMSPELLALTVRPQPFSVYYHIVSDEDVPHVRHLYKFRSINEFTRDLEILSRRFSVISLADLLDHIRAHRVLPRNALLLTFDDGFTECVDVIAPILLRKGLPATFFIISDCLDNRAMAHHNRISLLLDHLRRINSSALERQVRSRIVPDAGNRTLASSLTAIDYQHRHVVDELASLLDFDTAAYLSVRKPYLTSEQVRVLIRQGFTIGAHSIDHPAYSLLTLDEQIRQTTASLTMIKERFSLSYGAFAFPHGDDRVSDQFFARTLRDGGLDVTFGTGGIARDPRRRHFQRFSPENSGQAVERVLGRYYARCLFKPRRRAVRH